VKLKGVLDAVGVPLMVFPVNLSPGGTAPEVTLKVYGVVPPLTATTPVKEYGTPIAPVGFAVWPTCNGLASRDTVPAKANTGSKRTSNFLMNADMNPIFDSLPG
jgi:hypothetical protein